MDLRTTAKAPLRAKPSLRMYTQHHTTGSMAIFSRTREFGCVLGLAWGSMVYAGLAGCNEHIRCSMRTVAAARLSARSGIPASRDPAADACASMVLSRMQDADTCMKESW
jgi:hypothetical protein